MTAGGCLARRGQTTMEHGRGAAPQMRFSSAQARDTTDRRTVDLMLAQPEAMPAVSSVSDVPDRMATADLDVLIRAGALLAASLDYEVTLANIAQLVVPQLADYLSLIHI